MKKIKFNHYNTFTKKYEAATLEDFQLPLFGDKMMQKEANAEMKAFSTLIHSALNTGKNPVNLINMMVFTYFTNYNKETFSGVGYCDTECRESLYDFVIRCCEAYELDREEAIEIWNLAYNKAK